MSQRHDWNRIEDTSDICEQSDGGCQNRANWEKVSAVGIYPYAYSKTIYSGELYCDRCRAIEDGEGPPDDKWHQMSLSRCVCCQDEIASWIKKDVPYCEKCKRNKEVEDWRAERPGFEVFDVVITVKHFDKELFSSLQAVGSLAEAELIGLGMRHGAASCLEEVWGVEDLTATVEGV